MAAPRLDCEPVPCLGGVAGMLEACRRGDRRSAGEPCAAPRGFRTGDPATTGLGLERLFRCRFGGVRTLGSLLAALDRAVPFLLLPERLLLWRRLRLEPRLEVARRPRLLFFAFEVGGPAAPGLRFHVTSVDCREVKAHGWVRTGGATSQ